MKKNLLIVILTIFTLLSWLYAQEQKGKAEQCEIEVVQQRELAENFKEQFETQRKIAEENRQRAEFQRMRAGMESQKAVEKEQKSEEKSK